MADVQDLGLSGLQKSLSQALDHLLVKQGVPQETREAIVNSFEMMYEYIPYAIKQKKNPSDGAVLAEFLATKGMKMSKYLGNNSINCGVALVEFIKSGSAAYETTASPAAAFLPAPVLAWGLASLDLLEVGNSCDFVQDAVYHSFLKDSEHAIRRAEKGAASYAVP